MKSEEFRVASDDYKSCAFRVSRCKLSGDTFALDYNGTSRAASPTILSECYRSQCRGRRPRRPFLYHCLSACASNPKRTRPRVHIAPKAYRAEGISHCKAIYRSFCKKRISLRENFSRFVPLI